jgi:hypothetical protein
MNTSVISAIKDAAINIKIQRANSPDSEASKQAAERNRAIFPILEQNGISHGTVLLAATYSDRELDVMLKEYK